MRSGHMKLKKSIFFLFIILQIVTPAFSTIGYWGVRSETWKEFKKIEKIIYIQGIFDGLIFSDNSIQRTKLNLDIELEQYLEALNVIYSDYRNALIPVPFLMRVVTLEISCEDKEVVEEILKEYRRIFTQIK